MNKMAILLGKKGWRTFPPHMLTGKSKGKALGSATSWLPPRREEGSEARAPFHGEPLLYPGKGSGGEGLGWGNKNCWGGGGTGEGYQGRRYLLASVQGRRGSRRRSRGGDKTSTIKNTKGTQEALESFN